MLVILVNALTLHNYRLTDIGRIYFEGSYRGVQLRGPNPYPILGKAGPRKHTLFLGNLTIPGTQSSLDSKIPYFRENFIIPGTPSGPDSENIPYFKEIW